MIYFRDFVPSSVILTSPDPLQRAQSLLVQGDVLFSATRAFQLIFQDDGNLVLYGLDDTSLAGAPVPPPPQPIPDAQYNKVIWSSGTFTKDDPSPQFYHCWMQTDGNLVIYYFGKAVWASGTSGNPGAFLRVQDDGSLVILAPTGEVLATTGTNAGSR